MLELRKEFETEQTTMVVSGCIGPRGDGYDPGQVMSPREAEEYHSPQIRIFSEAGADMVTAITMTNANEASASRARRAGVDAGGDLLHARDRRQAADRAGTGRCDPGGRRRDRPRPPTT